MFSYRFGGAMLIEKKIANIAAPAEGSSRMSTGIASSSSFSSSSSSSSNHATVDQENMALPANLVLKPDRASEKENAKWETPVGVMLLKLKRAVPADDPLLNFAERRVFLKNCTVGKTFKRATYGEFLEVMHQSGLPLPEDESKKSTERLWESLTPLNRAYLALLLKVPATLYQSRDIDLMNLLHANGKGAKIISRTTLLAVCEFRQIPGSAFKDKNKLIDRLCTPQDFYELEPHQWGTNMIVRVLLCLAEYGVDAGIEHCQDPAIFDGHEDALAAYDPYCKVFEQVLNPNVKFSPAVISLDSVNSKYASDGQMSAQTKSSSSSAGDLQIHGSAVDEDKGGAFQAFTKKVLRNTNHGYGGLPRTLRQDLPEAAGPFARERWLTLGRLAMKLRLDLVNMSKSFLSSQNSTMKDPVSYIEYCQRNYPWDEEVCLWQYLLIHSHMKYLKVLGPATMASAMLPPDTVASSADYSSKLKKSLAKVASDSSNVTTSIPREDTSPSQPVELVAVEDQAEAKLKPIVGKKRRRVEDLKNVEDKEFDPSVERLCKENVKKSDNLAISKQTKSELKRRRLKLDVLMREVELRKAASNMPCDFNALIPGYDRTQGIEEEITRKIVEYVTCLRQVPQAKSEFVISTLQRKLQRLKKTILLLESFLA